MRIARRGGIACAAAALAPPAVPPINLVMTEFGAIGDSLTEGGGALNPWEVFVDKNPAYTFYNEGLGGATIADIPTQLAALLAIEPDGPDSYIGTIVGMFGPNDLGRGSHVSGSAYWEEIKTHLAPAIALGINIIWRVPFSQILPSNVDDNETHDANYDIYRAQLLTALLADIGTPYLAGVIDSYLDVVMGQDDSPELDTTNIYFVADSFGWRVHLTGTDPGGYVRDEQWTTPFLEAFFANTTNQTPFDFEFAPVTGAALSAVTEAAETYTVQGLGRDAGGDQVSVAVTVEDGLSYRINGGSWVTSAGTVEDGDEINVRITSSGSYETTVTGTINVGTRSVDFSVESETEEPADPATAIAGAFEYGEFEEPSPITLAGGTSLGVGQYIFILSNQGPREDTTTGLALTGTASVALTRLGASTNGSNYNISMWKGTISTPGVYNAVFTTYNGSNAYVAQVHAIKLDGAYSVGSDDTLDLVSASGPNDYASGTTLTPGAGGMVLSAIYTQGLNQDDVSFTNMTLLEVLEGAGAQRSLVGYSATAVDPEVNLSTGSSFITGFSVVLNPA